MSDYDALAQYLGQDVNELRQMVGTAAMLRLSFAAQEVLDTMPNYTDIAEVMEDIRLSIAVTPETECLVHEQVASATAYLQASWLLEQNLKVEEASR